MILGIQIARLEYQEKQLAIDVAPIAKSIRLDVYTEDNKGTAYNIEMQVRSIEDLPKRGRYYQDLIDLNLIDKGAYYENLPRCIVIFVCEFDRYHRGKLIYSFRRREDEIHDLEYGDDTQMVVVNLNGSLEGASKALRDFVQYMKNGKVETKYIRELHEEVVSVRSNEKWRRDMRTLQDALKDEYRVGKKEGFEEGRAAGLQQGMEQGMEQGIETGTEQTIRRIKEVCAHLTHAGRDTEISKVVDELSQYCKEFGIT